MSRSPDFSGTKIVLHSDEELIAYLRDDKPGIPFPGLWDLPGGGREGNETPAECAVREVKEEFGLEIPVDRIRFTRCYPSPVEGGLASYFVAAVLVPGEIEAIAFGDEGQIWQMMSFEDFIGETKAVPDLRDRVREYHATLGG